MRVPSRSGLPSPSTSTPWRMARMSCIRSATVWRSPSRLPISASGPRIAVDTPSVLPMRPSPSRSSPRPPAGTTSGSLLRCLMVSVLSGPPPWPTTLMATVAKPRRAKVPATERGDQVLVVTEAVAEDDDGPARRGHRARGQEEHRLDALVTEDRGSPRAGRARDVARTREERRALEGAQGDRADIGGRHQVELERYGLGEAFGPAGGDLAAEHNALEGGARKHAAGPAGRLDEVHWRRGSRLDHRPHLLEAGRHRERGEESRCDHLVAGEAEGAEPLHKPLVRRRATSAAQRLACVVQHSRGNHERVRAPLAKDALRPRVERSAFGVPDQAGEADGLRPVVAQGEDEDIRARDAVELHGPREAERHARIHAPAVEAVEQVDLVAGGRRLAAAHQREMDTTAGELGGVGLGEAISGQKHPHLGGLRGHDRGEEECEGGGETRSPIDHLGAGVGGPLGAGASGRRGGCAGRVAAVEAWYGPTTTSMSCSLPPRMTASFTERPTGVLAMMRWRSRMPSICVPSTASTTSSALRPPLSAGCPATTWRMSTPFGSLSWYLAKSSSPTSAMPTPSHPHSTLPLEASCGRRPFTRLMGMAKPMVPLRAAMLLMPITSPAMLTSGPPELPGFTVASVWMKSKPGAATRSGAPLRLTMPKETDCSRPKGWPRARTNSPMRSLLESPRAATGSPVASIFTRARSTRSSLPTRRPSNRRPSASLT